MSFKVQGADGLSKEIAKMGADIKRKVAAELEYTGHEMRDEIIRKYNSGPATGNIYQLTNPKRTHRASKVGEYPMTDQGALVAGTLFKKVGPLTVEVFNNVEYAAALEYGSRGQGPRPAWRDTVDETQPEFIKRIKAIVAKGAKK